MSEKEKLERMLDDIMTSDPSESASMAKEIYETYQRLRAERLRKSDRESKEQKNNQGV